jgi:ribonuclease P protein component
VKAFSLGKNERIKERKIFEQLYKSGNTILLKNYSLKIIYLAEKSDISCVKIAVGISKKAGNSVWRNRLKRLIRNAYRLNKLQILDLAKRKGMKIYILFSSVSLNQSASPKLKYKEIENQVISLLSVIVKKLDSVLET